MVEEFERKLRLKRLQWSIPDTLYLVAVDGQARVEEDPDGSENLSVAELLARTEVPGVLPEPPAPPLGETCGKCLNCAEYGRNVSLLYLGRMFCPECGWYEVP